MSKIRHLIILVLLMNGQQAFSASCYQSTMKEIASISEVSERAEVFDLIHKAYPSDALSRAVLIERLIGPIAVALETSKAKVISVSTKNKWNLFDSIQIPSRPMVIKNGEVYKKFSAAPFSEGLVFFRKTDFNKDQGSYIAEVPDLMSYSKEDVLNHLKTNSPLKTKQIEVMDFKPSDNAKLVNVFSPGTTSIRSHTSRMLGFLKVLSSKQPSELRADYLLNALSGKWDRFSAIALDNPFHASASFSKEYMGLGSVKYYEKFLEETNFNDKSIVWTTRSSANLPIAELVKKSSQDPNPPVKAMIWVSPVLPELKFFEDGFEGAYSAKEDKNLANGTALVSLKRTIEELNNQNEQSKWWKSKVYPFGKTPLLIITGSKDPETPLDTRKYLIEFAKRFPDMVIYKEIEGAGHDPFAVGEAVLGGKVAITEKAKAQAAEAWSTYYDFLNYVKTLENESRGI